jgi:hypothetical protein
VTPLLVVKKEQTKKNSTTTTTSKKYQRSTSVVKCSRHIHIIFQKGIILFSPVTRKKETGMCVEKWRDDRQ